MGRAAGDQLGSSMLYLLIAAALIVSNTLLFYGYKLAEEHGFQRGRNKIMDLLFVEFNNASEQVVRQKLLDLGITIMNLEWKEVKKKAPNEHT